MMINHVRGLLTVVSSPSGGGKTTIVRAVRESMGLDYSVSSTTRQPRAGEKDGVDYKFLSKSAFLRYIEENKFIEWAEVHGELYGTDRTYLLEKLAEGRTVLLDIDVQGALNIKTQFPEAVLIFIAPPSLETLENRLRGRGTEPEESIRARLERAGYEMEKARRYDYTVVNDDLQKAASEVCSIIRKEISKRQGGGYGHDNTV